MTAATRWLRHNLFRTKRDAFLTLVFGTLAIWLIYKTVRFVFVTGRWTIIEVNLRILMVGRYPEVHDLRLAVTLIVLAAWGGLLAGFLRGRQFRAGRITSEDSKLTAARVLDLFERLWIPLAVIVLLLMLSGTAGPWLMVGLALVAALAGRLIGPVFGRLRLGAAVSAVIMLVFAAVPLGMYFYVVTAVGFDGWGGFMLNLFLSVCSIILCYPLGVLLALGRRSGLPLVRLVCTAYIEIIRGAPLFVLLLLANVALGFFVPDSLAPRPPHGRSSCSRSSPRRTWQKSSVAACSRSRVARSRRPKRWGSPPSARPATSCCRRHCAT